jgi:hypothetical protein
LIYPLDSEFLPWVGREELAAIEADDSWLRSEVARCKEEPWYWLVNYVWTIQKDEFTEGQKPQAKRFACKEHLRYILDCCFRERRLVVDKSRQMTLSWLLMAYCLYWLQFGSHEEIICQTKKEDDVEALIWRCHFMLTSQRYWLRPPFEYRAGKGGKITVMGKDGRRLNTLQGIPGGAGAGDQIRSKNPSRYFLDEGGFIDEFSECRLNAEACSQDIKIVSTANMGDFESFILDRKVG